MAENTQLNKFSSVTSDQKERYDSKMEYMGEVGKCREELKVAFEEFIELPSSMGFVVLESKMMKYQNVRMNCTYIEV